jgi:hypothetical protein
MMPSTTAATTPTGRGNVKKSTDPSVQVSLNHPAVTASAVTFMDITLDDKIMQDDSMEDDPGSK